MASTANAILTPPIDSTGVEPYSMHVSARYLELTKRKLELTRMPREIPLDKDRAWGLGTPKSVLEPLVDYWLETYDWRAQETALNASLKQFRTVIKYPPPSSTQDLEAATGAESLRIHFLHHTSNSRTAIPLLYIHSYPGSFLEISRCIDALTNPAPIQTPTPTQTWKEPVAFHVVAPSIPGFAFSDSSSKEDFGAKHTAGVFVGLMNRLGYQRFAVWGDGFGFKVARMLAMWFPENVAGVYTSFPGEIPEPKGLGWWKWQVARITGAKFPWCSFGYEVEDFGGAEIEKEEEVRKDGAIEMGEVPSKGLGLLIAPAAEDEVTKKMEIQKIPAFQTNGVARRPQTLSYGLCDSPAGLLALLLDALRPTILPPNKHPEPRLQPQGRKRSDTILQHPSPNLRPHIRQPAFSATDILNWTMMYWLPGPEASHRWLLGTVVEDCYEKYSTTPLGISWYASQTGSPVFASAVQDLKWIKRRHERLESGIPAWERSAEAVMDLREYFGSGRKEGWLGL